MTAIEIYQAALASAAALASYKPNWHVVSILEHLIFACREAGRECDARCYEAARGYHLADLRR